MKRMTALSKAATMALIASAGVGIQGALNHFTPGARSKSKPAPSKPVDLYAIAKAEAKRQRKAQRNMELKK